LNFVTKLTRYLTKIFAFKATNSGVFGSAVSGTLQVVPDGNVETMQSLPAYEAGWSDAVIGSMGLPVMEEMQGVQYGMSYMLKYLLQMGIPGWHPQETYYENCFCGHKGTIWFSLVNNNIGVEPGTNNIFWKAGGGAKGGGSMGPPGSIIPYSGMVVPDGYLRCDGATVSRGDYGDLFDAIGTMYNTGGESSSIFRLPNFNGEGVFLQGSSTAGTKRDAGLPNITGTFGDNRMHASLISGCMSISGTCTSAPTSGNWYNTGVTMDASRSSSIYGKSNTVQPPSSTVIFLILY
jgi:microcystin-dependent protein